MSRYLFVYGTLQFPAVFRVVSGRSVPGEPAKLPGYARYQVRGERYPGIVPGADSTVDGILLRGITDDDLARLDRFEGDFYRRERVEVMARGAALHAWCYVVAPRQRNRLVDAPWDMQAFAENHLDGYLRRLKTT